MRRTIISRSMMPILLLVALCLAGLAHPASAKPPTKTQTKGNVREAKAASAPTSATEDLVPLQIKLPPHTVLSVPPMYFSYIRKDTENLYTSKIYNSRLPFMVPQSIRLLSFHKKVTASDEPMIGELDWVTDGDKNDNDGNCIELNHDVQWVQIDLGEFCDVYAIVIWHPFLLPPVYHDVIVQCADDPDFKKGVKTLFNNDADNSAKLGKGTDQEYVDT